MKKKYDLTLHYTQDEVIDMVSSLEIAYELIDVEDWVDNGLKKAISLLNSISIQMEVQE